MPRQAKSGLRNYDCSLNPLLELPGFAALFLMWGLQENGLIKSVLSIQGLGSGENGIGE